MSNLLLAGQPPPDPASILQPAAAPAPPAPAVASVPVPAPAPGPTAASAERRAQIRQHEEALIEASKRGDVHEARQRDRKITELKLIDAMDGGRIDEAKKLDVELKGLEDPHVGHYDARIGRMKELLGTLKPGAVGYQAEKAALERRIARAEEGRTSYLVGSSPGGRAFQADMAGRRAAQAPIGDLEAGLAGAAQGFTFGGSDELQGLARAGEGNVLRGGYRMLTGAPGAKREYGMGQAMERDRLERAREQAPLMALGGEFAGAAVNPLSWWTGGAGTVARGAPMMTRIGQGLANTGRVAGAAAATGGVYGGLAAEGDFMERFKEAGKGAAVAGGLATGGEAVLGGLSALGRRFTGAPMPMARTPTGAVVPDPEVANRVALADRFNTRLTRGQATADVVQQGEEETMRAGGRGPSAAGSMKTFREQQQEATQQAADAMAQRFTGGQMVDQATGGEAVTAGLAAKAAGMKKEAETAFTEFGKKEASVAADEAGGLKGKITADLAARDTPIYLDPRNHPMSTQALEIFDNLTGLRGAGTPPLPPGQNAQLSSMSVGAVEKARRAVVALRPEKGSDDARVLRAVKEAFDKRLDDMAQSAGFRGDPTAVQTLKDARSKWSKYLGLTDPEKDAHTGEAIVARIINEKRTGEEVAAWLTAHATPQQAGNASRAADMIKQTVGENSPEWTALKQMTLHRVFNPTKGTGGPQALASSIETFLKQGRSLANQMFTPAEIGELREFARLQRILQGDQYAKNPSGTGHAISRIINQSGLLRAAIGAGLGGGGASAIEYFRGNPLVSASHAAAVGAMAGASGVSRALAAQRAIPSRIPQIAREVARVPFRAGAPLLKEQVAPEEPR